MTIEGGIKSGIFLGLSEVGKIKIGGKGEERKTGDGKKTYNLPVKFGHFVVTTTEKGTGKDKNFITDKAVMDVIGAEPKEISIQFPFDDRHMNFRTSYMYYKGNKKQCEGNGEVAERKGSDGKITEGPCTLETCEFMNPKEVKGKKPPALCKPSGILSCYIPASPHRGGIYRFRTHGWNSTGGIMAALKQYSDYTDGVLQGLPFKLVFTKKSTEEHGNVPVVTLVLDGVELDGMRELVMKERQARVEFGTDIKLIEHTAKKDGFMEDTDDEADVEAEFYGENEPENEAGASSEDVEAVMSEPGTTEMVTDGDAPPEEKQTDEKPDLF